ncbi:MAG: hypothetical protein RLZZ226_1797 [Pseudomonadota bacterium]
MSIPLPPPVVVCFSGHDPTGGAGVQADIETISRFGCHAASVITCLTVQDSVNVRRLIAQNRDDFSMQAHTLLADLPVAVFKIGLLGDAMIAEAVADVLETYPAVPVVLDPILAAGGGQALAGERLLAVIRTRLIPRTTLLTPNTPEAFRLTGLNDPEQAGQALLAAGCAHVLLTGTHETAAEGQAVINRWFSAEGIRYWQWPRLPHCYHGSGCTLAAAAAACLARRGCTALPTVLTEAQQFAWNSLQQGYAIGRGQWFPARSAPPAPLNR